MTQESMVIVGYDLGEEKVLMSVYNEDAREPETVEFTRKEDGYYLPVSICRVKMSREWLIGDRAREYAKREEVPLFEDFNREGLLGEKIEIEGEQFTYEELLEQFIMKSLQVITRFCSIKDVDEIVFTTEHPSDRICRIIYRSAAAAGIEEKRIHLQSYGESFVYYAFNQKRELWRADNGLFEYSRKGMKYIQICRSKKTRPNLVTLHAEEFLDLFPAREENPLHLTKEDIDKRFVRVLQKAFKDQEVSTVYLTGEGFDQGWMKESLKPLCAGRRVFVGQNLYAKGACYSGIEYIFPALSEEFFLVSEDKVFAEVGLRVRLNKEEVLFPLAEITDHWYEAERSVEVILDEVKEIVLELRNLNDSTVRFERILLNDLPDRVNKAIRLKIEIRFISSEEFECRITDAGFGEFYSATQKVYQRTIRMDKRETGGEVLQEVENQWQG